MSIIEASVFKNPQQLVSNQFCLTRIDALARYVKVQKIINNGTGPAIARLEGGGGGSEYCSSKKGKAIPPVNKEMAQYKYKYPHEPIDTYRYLTENIPATAIS